MYTKENWSVFVDAWIVQAHLSFDKIFEDAKFREGGKLGSGEAVPPAP
jgi:hypothetical protein